MLLAVSHPTVSAASRSSSARNTKVSRGQLRVAASVTAIPSAAIPVDTKAVRRVKLRTRSDCELGVSVYPKFAYNAVGGGGWADLEDLGNGLLKATFDAKALFIPSMSWRTATLFHVPIPPPLDIAIMPQRLEGVINTVTGEANLEFDAEFSFTAGSLYKAPPLIVRTLLTTESTKGSFREATGSRFSGSHGRLVGTATVAKTGDVFMDTFLMLPTDALAIMSAELDFQ